MITYFNADSRKFYLSLCRRYCHTTKIFKVMSKNDFQCMSGINSEMTEIKNWFFLCELHSLGNEIAIYIPSDCVTFHNMVMLLVRSGVEVVVKGLVEK